MKIIAVILLIMLAGFSYAHEEIEHSTPEEDFAHSFDDNALNIALYGFGILLAVTLFTIRVKDKLKEKHKKILFIFMVILVGVITLFLAFGTIYVNLVSESGGPVHWHADFEIHVCGEKQELPKAVDWCYMTEGSPLCSLTNRVGTSVFHHHDDFRIHVEGVVVKVSDVNLGNFFRVIGGSFNENSITIPQNDGSVKTYVNGDTCPNGSAGKIRMTVNGVENNEFGDYVLKPFSTVPPGDFIRIYFGE